MQQLKYDAIWCELNAQTGEIRWSELQRYFARGTVIYVSRDLDLVDVAVKFVRDEVESISELTSIGKVVRATDVHARDWSHRNPVLWAVVSAPWVLVQERN